MDAAVASGAGVDEDGIEDAFDLVAEVGGVGAFGGEAFRGVQVGGSVWGGDLVAEVGGGLGGGKFGGHCGTETQGCQQSQHLRPPPIQPPPPPLPPQPTRPPAPKRWPQVPERVRTGLWVGDCFIYNNAAWRLNYCVGGEVRGGLAGF